MARIFISYSRHDQSIAKQLATDLAGLGADVWLDVDDIPPGMDWSNAIQEGLDTCEVMLLIVSPASMESANVQDEWKYFKDQDKPLFPVLLEPAKLHFQLHRLQYIDFHGQPYAAAFHDLCAAINAAGVPINMPVIPADGSPDVPGAVPDSPLQPAPGSRGISRTYWLTGTVVAAVALLAVIVVFSGGFDGLLNTGSGNGDDVTPGPTQFSNTDTTSPPVDGALGVRVWHMEEAIDWEQVAAAGYMFAVIDASEGNVSVDPSFGMNWRAAQDAGLLVTALHYFRPKTPVQAQVDQFFGALGERFTDLPLVIDVEEYEGLDSSLITTELKTFADAIEEITGQRPIILTTVTFWNDHITDAVDWSAYDLMIIGRAVDTPALPTPWEGWTFLLYDREGTVPGIPEPVPLIVHNGSEEDLRMYVE